MADTEHDRATDPVIEAYKRDVDVTLFDRNLALTPSERLEQLQRFVQFVWEMREARKRAGDGAHGDSTD